MAQVFSCKFCEISTNTFLTEQLWATASERCSAEQQWLQIPEKFWKNNENKYHIKETEAIFENDFLFHFTDALPELLHYCIRYFEMTRRSWRNSEKTLEKLLFFCNFEV